VAETVIATEAASDEVEKQPVEASPPRRRDRVLAQFVAVWPAIAIYLGMRVFSVVIVTLYAHARGLSALEALDHRHDAQWYQLIVNHGYDTHLVVGPTGQFRPSNLAFFPLYPGATWLLKHATGLATPTATPTAALIVAWLAGVAAAWGIFKVGQLVKDRRAGVMLVALWVVLPHAIVQSMAYSETLFVALASWTMYAVLKRNWITAGVLSVFAGLCRPTASAVIAMVGLAALVAVIRRRDGWRPWLALVLCPLGYLGYLAFVAVRLHRIDGYLYVERATWGTGFDGGKSTFTAFARSLQGEHPLGVFVVMLMIVLTLLFYVVTLLDRPPWPIIVFGTVGIAMVLGAYNEFIGEARYLMAIFPILLPIAGALAKARTWTATTILIGLALIAAWYGSYLLLTWRWSP
jgi:hypothetical protein